jgi:1-acyl-sn-glycerol-3-phosphate acyltransferase
MPSSPLTIPSLFRAAIHVLIFVAHLSIANTLLTLLLVYSFIFPTLTYNLASLIAASVWTHIQHIFTRSNGARILVTGDPLPQNESAIVLSNHVEWSDFYMIQELALRANMLGRCRWFAKKELKWVPFLGWGLWAMGMPLVSRKWMQDKRELRRVFDGVARRKWPICTFELLFSPYIIPNQMFFHAPLLSSCRHARKPVQRYLSDYVLPSLIRSTSDRIAQSTLNTSQTTTLWTSSLTPHLQPTRVDILQRRHPPNPRKAPPRRSPRLKNEQGPPSTPLIAPNKRLRSLRPTPPNRSAPRESSLRLDNSVRRPKPIRTKQAALQREEEKAGRRKQQWKWKWSYHHRPGSSRFHLPIPTNIHPIPLLPNHSFSLADAGPRAAV